MMEEKRPGARDHFRASIEGEELIMEPFCACGTYLNEEYFCEQCKKQCTCTEIRCADEKTLDLVNSLLQNNASFHNFTAVLEDNQ